MADIPTFDQWMKDTYSLTSPRSEFLKKLDEALRIYDKARSPQNKEALKTAMDRWRFEQSKKGQDWRKSVRNQKGAVTNLHRALLDVDKRKLSEEELEAMRFISRAQALALQKMFDGKQLQFKPTTVLGAVQGAGSKWERFKTGASALQSGAGTGKSLYDAGKNIKKGVDLLQHGGRAAALAASQSDMTKNIDGIRAKVNEFCKQLCPGLDPNHIFNALHLGNVEHFATSLAPFVGAISSGGKALIGWAGVVKDAYDKASMKGSRDAFAPKDPEAAFDALIELMDREMNSDIAKASVKTAAFGGKLLGSFADFGAATGPVVGLLELLAEIFQTIIEYVRDYKECQAANEELRLGALNMDIFKVSPILGCYFLVVQDHSTIINFAVADYGTVNWMFDVERLVGRVGKALDKSRQLIHSSRLEVPGMSNAKGVVDANYSVKTGFARVTGAPGALKDKIAQTIDGWFDNPVKPPKVDRARIVGFGSDNY